MTATEKPESEKDGWYLRDVILALTHRWDIIIVFTLVGALMGWGVSYLWPSPYQATRTIHVGLNAYRFADDAYAESLAGQPFRLVDDYKNWQMEQLNDLIFTDDFIQDTVDHLQEKDPYWEAISPEEFRRMASVTWRNVGEWNLIIKTIDSKRAAEAVLAWEETILDRINQAIEHSNQVVSLDMEMKQLVDNRQKLELRLERLTYVSEKLSFLVEVLGKKPEASIVTSLERSNLLLAVAQASDWQPAWDKLLDGAPPIGSTVGETLSWIESVIAFVEEERKLIPQQISLMDEAFSSLRVHYDEEVSRSLGLSSTLLVEGDEETEVSLDKIRPKGILILVGGIFGLLTWILWGFRSIQFGKNK